MVESYAGFAALVVLMWAGVLCVIGTVAWVKEKVEDRD